MMRRPVSSALLFVMCFACQCHKPTVAVDPAPAHRSPIDFVLLDDHRAVVAQHTADAVALVDLRTGRILQEAPTGRKPAALALAPGGQRIAVSNHWSHDILLLDVEGDRLVPQASLAVGALPRGVAFSRDGQHLYVALSGADEIATIDVASRKVVERWPAPREPRALVVSADGKWLAAASSRSSEVRCWNLITKRLHWARTIDNAFNLRGLAFTPDGSHIVVAHGIRRDLPVMRAHIEEGWIIDSRLTRLPVAAQPTTPYLQIALDVRSEAFGDPHGLAFSPNGEHLVVAGSGSHELILLRTEHLPWSTDPGDTIDGRLLDGKQFRRVPLGGRPMAVTFTKSGERIVVANYLLDAVQVVDVAESRRIDTVALGGPKTPSLARQGEALFYDAQRSHAQWFSCHSCHSDGHTNSMTFDTLNDDSFGTLKLTPTLRNVAKTGPWTWHGWQKDLGAAVTKSFSDTMYGPLPSKRDEQAVVAFLQTLEHPPMPKQSDPAIARGQAIFSSKARCAHCHRPPHYTAPEVFDVKLDSGGGTLQGFNPPSLLGLSQRGPYLHDGRARTLEEVLRVYHTPRHIGGPTLSEAEERDLMVFLRSL